MPLFANKQEHFLTSCTPISLLSNTPNHQHTVYRCIFLRSEGLSYWLSPHFGRLSLEICTPVVRVVTKVSPHNLRLIRTNAAWIPTRVQWYWNAIFVTHTPSKPQSIYGTMFWNELTLWYSVGTPASNSKDPKFDFRSGDRTPNVHFHNFTHGT